MNVKRHLLPPPSSPACRADDAPGKEQGERRRMGKGKSWEVTGSRCLVKLEHGTSLCKGVAQEKQGADGAWGTWFLEMLWAP